MKEIYELKRDLNTHRKFILGMGILVLCLHVYLELYSFFASGGLTNPLLDAILSKLTTKSTLLNSPWTLKFFGAGCIMLYFGFPGSIQKKNRFARGFWAMAWRALLFLGSTLMLRDYVPRFLQWFTVPGLSLAYIVATGTGLIGLIKGLRSIINGLDETPVDSNLN